MPGYLTKQEVVAITGVDDLLIRSLFDRQQFADPFGVAERLGISSAAWPLFGLLWPSGRQLAARLAQRAVTPGERILEIGCGLAIASLVGHRQGRSVTASDCHPLAGAFLAENLRLNHLPPMAYRHGPWPAAAAGDETAQDSPVNGQFDLIMGSDILYERDEQGTLAAFIASHASLHAEVWVVDPDRGNRSAFHRHMARHGFVLREDRIDQPATATEVAYKGRLLTYRAGSA